MSATELLRTLLSVSTPNAHKPSLTLDENESDIQSLQIDDYDVEILIKAVETQKTITLSSYSKDAIGTKPIDPYIIIVQPYSSSPSIPQYRTVQAIHSESFFKEWELMRIPGREQYEELVARIHSNPIKFSIKTPLLSIRKFCENWIDTNIPPASLHESTVRLFIHLALHCGIHEDELLHRGPIIFSDSDEFIESIVQEWKDVNESIEQSSKVDLQQTMDLNSTLFMSSEQSKKMAILTYMRVSDPSTLNVASTQQTPLSATANYYLYLINYQHQKRDPSCRPLFSVLSLVMASFFAATDMLIKADYQVNPIRRMATPTRSMHVTGAANRLSFTSEQVLTFCNHFCEASECLYNTLRESEKNNLDETELCLELCQEIDYMLESCACRGNIPDSRSRILLSLPYPILSHFLHQMYGHCFEYDLVMPVRYKVNTRSPLLTDELEPIPTPSQLMKRTTYWDYEMDEEVSESTYLPSPSINWLLTTLATLLDNLFLPRVSQHIFFLSHIVHRLVHPPPFPSDADDDDLPYTTSTRSFYSPKSALFTHALSVLEQAKNECVFLKTATFTHSQVQWMHILHTQLGDTASALAGRMSDYSVFFFGRSYLFAPYVQIHLGIQDFLSQMSCLPCFKPPPPPPPRTKPPKTF
ncbi:hypothetical protein BLNAU_5803 [Blattamonas nauphoetae]|uniref:Uncharacterized protein n=1 Tax=Blattamonas nauphoetae TaxID=2049346 RepID=A0ABQ9Y667_9EUKA|nr:hypothetical protein BLNAU_5803 [Blattamonas nauphoetae]